MGDHSVNVALVALTMIFPFYLTDVIGMRIGLAGLVPLVGRSTDAIFDVMMGRISDRTTWKAGRRRPYLLIGAVPFALSFAALWAAPTIENPSLEFAYLRRHLPADQPVHDGRGGPVPRTSTRADRRLPRAHLAGDLPLGRLDSRHALHPRRLPAARRGAGRRRPRLADCRSGARVLDRAPLASDLVGHRRTPRIPESAAADDAGVFPSSSTATRASAAWSVCLRSAASRSIFRWRSSSTTSRT